MSSHRAYVLERDGGSLNLKTVQTPTPIDGQVLVEVLAAPVLSYVRRVLNQGPHGLVFPLTPGVGAIGRIVATGPDTTTLKKNHLVFCDPTVRARDDSTGCTTILQGWYAGERPHARKLMEGSWRNGSWAERMLVPTENVIPLDEDTLINSMGYSFSQLCWIVAMLVPLGGLLAAGLKAGDSIIVAPATGHFGGAAVTVALALGASRVIAAGRNEGFLKRVAAMADSKRVKTVRLSGEVGADAQALKEATPGGNGADVYIDFLPPEAENATSPEACIAALRNGGEAVLMGGVKSKISFTYNMLTRRNIVVRGRHMYGPDALRTILGLLESGLLSLKGLQTTVFKFEQLDEAIDFSAKDAGAGRITTVSPVVGH